MLTVIYLYCYILVSLNQDTKLKDQWKWSELRLWWVWYVISRCSLVTILSWFIPQKGSYINIPKTNVDWVRFFCPESVSEYQKLKGIINKRAVHKSFALVFQLYTEWSDDLMFMTRISTTFRTYNNMPWRKSQFEPHPIPTAWIKTINFVLNLVLWTCQVKDATGVDRKTKQRIA